MKQIENIAYVCIALTFILIVIYWLGQAIAWNKQQADQQRALCVKETHDGYFCNIEW